MTRAFTIMINLITIVLSFLMSQSFTSYVCHILLCPLANLRPQLLYIWWVSPVLPFYGSKIEISWASKMRLLQHPFDFLRNPQHLFD
ncbi:hypothetical protein BJ170DRAFT_398669 [Xylariales sp. AK1849]|nr:hypothetical protein BJ170DRAFT_398669 [Xylariales sp. AK1849]